MGKRRHGEPLSDPEELAAQAAPVDTDADTDPAPAPEPMQRPPSLTRELARVEELNFLFYEAFHERDINRMAELWSQSGYVRCIHPGWEPVIGWPDIRQSWVEIFESMTAVEFELEDVHVEVAGTSAWVNLIAHARVTSDDDEAFETAVVATSVLEKTEDTWTIVLHHSSHFADEDDDDVHELEIDSPFGTGGEGDDKPN